MLTDVLFINTLAANSVALWLVAVLLGSRIFCMFSRK